VFRQRIRSIEQVKLPGEIRDLKQDRADREDRRIVLTTRQQQPLPGSQPFPAASVDMSMREPSPSATAKLIA
jgi:hypothetical protein